MNHDLARQEQLEKCTHIYIRLSGCVEEDTFKLKMIGRRNRSELWKVSIDGVTTYRNRNE